MTQQIKNRLIQSLAFLILVIAPWFIGVKALFGINIEIQPINVNKPILYAMCGMIGVAAWLIIKVAGQSTWERVEVKEEKPEVIEVERSHTIQKGSGNVNYDALTEYNFLKGQNYSADRWRELSSKYQGKQYRGDEWKQIRMLCLNKIKSSPEAVMTGRTIEFTL